MTAPNADRPVDDFEVERWRDPALPPGLVDLVAEAEREGHAWIGAFRDDWETQPYLGAGEALFVVSNQGRPVGMAAISAARSGETGTGRLKHIYVGPGARGRGLLRALVERCLARADERWQVVTLHTDNPVAAHIYEDYGFRPTTAHGHSTHARERLYSAAVNDSGTP